ncbi:MAG: chorismate mutase [Firmicutes bacterium]|nr:chorismate mutase [Bacillota bacterium]
MSKLDDARRRINEIDAEIAQLFERRLDAVGDVLEYKRANNLPIFDGGREQQVVEKNLALLQNKEYRPYYRQFILHLMDISKDYQRAMLQHNVAAYAGVEGAFAWQATRSLFPTYNYLACQDFESVFIEVLEGRAAFGVIPFENSYTGEVGEVFDLLFKYDCHIQGICDLPVRQNLLALPGATLSSVRKVYSHPQALSQCAKFLQEYKLETVEYVNTALAAKYVAESGDTSLAAIASLETAELYGLDVLAETINISKQNTTRFVVISRELKPTGSRFNLLFTVGHNAGQLARVMSLIGDMGFNMESIKSRPVKELPWQYYFYVEIEGKLDDPRAEELLQRLKTSCDTCKLLGSYDIRKL